MIYDAIRARLLADPDIKSAVTGIFRLEAPQGQARPFVTMQQISRTQWTKLDGDAGTHEARYQINIIGDSPNHNPGALAAWVLAQLAGWQQSESPRVAMDLILEIDGIDREPGAGQGIHRIQQDYIATFEV